MSKPLFFISCPIDTYSGYGARSRDLVRAIIELDKYDVKIIPQLWGNTPWGFINDNPEWGFLDKHIWSQPQLPKQPEIWMQITVPNEFMPIGKYNIGVTAGVESNICAADLIEGANRMNLTLISSEHSKQVFKNSKFEKRNKQTNQVEGIIELNKPIEVLFEGANLDIYLPQEPAIKGASVLSDTISDIKEDDIVKNKKSNNVYVVKKMDPSKHIKPASNLPSTQKLSSSDFEKQSEKLKGKTSGKDIQTADIGGGKIYGTIHRNTKMVDDIVDHVKSTIPKDRWKDVVFVGEGGATNDKGELVFHDEMEYAVPKFLEMGAGIDTFDGDELDVHNPKSLLYKNQMKKTGLPHNIIKAGNWASMIGQGEGTDTMSPSIYLDDTGKQFLQNSAKEAGLSSIENWENPTDKDKDTLYRLSFPEDYNDRETKVNDIQVAFNQIRDENIIKKSNELQKNGKIPIVIAGEGHVELVKNAMKQESKLSEFSLRSIIKSIK